MIMNDDTKHNKFKFVAFIVQIRDRNDVKRIEMWSFSKMDLKTPSTVGILSSTAFGVEVF